MSDKPLGDKRFFFVHVMKTGGSSFADVLGMNFADDQRYPEAVLSPDLTSLHRIGAYTCVPKLVDAVNAQEGRLRLIRGHVPYAVRSLLDDHYEVITVLRDPVERTLSYLKHCRKYHKEHSTKAIEEVYEEAWFFESFIHDYQTKVFSMNGEEALAEVRVDDRASPLPPRGEFVDGADLPAEAQLLLQESPARLTLELFSPSTGAIDADAQRLVTAKENLSQVELVGVTEAYDRFLEQLRLRHGWDVSSTTRKNVGEDMDVAESFRRRIAEDSSLDMELYELARTLAP